MKLFSRAGDEEETDEDAAAEGGEASTSESTIAETQPAPVPEPEPEPEGPDVTEVLDQSVKELSGKLAGLARNLEESQADRTSFEDKVQRMEERMRKLSSLTEMISAQYNPFVGDAPEQRDDIPDSVEEGLGLSKEEVALAKQAAKAQAEAAKAPAPPPEPEPPAETVLVAGDLPAVEAPAPTPAPAPAPAPAAVVAEPEPGRLTSVPEGFESSMLMLNWAETLLRESRSRDHATEVARYYHRVGWIGEHVRDTLLVYLDGLAAKTAADVPDDWRSGAELHERSLLVIEKLKRAGPVRPRSP